MVHPVNLDNAKWLGNEFLKIFYNPVGVAGGLLDAFRGWKFSRSWVRFWFHVPSIGLLTAVYVIFGFSVFSREDGRIQMFSVESQKRCTTKTLEAACDQMHEADVLKVIGASNSEATDFKTTPISDLTKRYVELLSKRILEIQPGNLVAHYRLGMIFSLTGETEAAAAEMTNLASGTHGECPQANAWMVKALFKKKVAGEEVSSTQLISNLEKASKWKEIDFRLVAFYARLLEESGEPLKAIAVIKSGAVARPELNVELIRLYSKVGSPEELKSAATLVEDVFMKRLNSPIEKESDRLAVAEARKLTDRLELAAEILIEGLRTQSCSPATKRELSEIQRLVYLKSIHRTVAGQYEADISLLEKVVDSDPSNPNISFEIAKLLPLRVKPSKKLLEVLKQQSESGVTNAPTHVLLAEGYLAFGNIKEAIRNWEIALTQDPNQVGAMNNLALVLAKTSATNIDRSLNLLYRALSLSPANAEILDSLGDVYLIAKKPKEALNKYELSIRNDPSRLGTQKKLLIAYELNGMVDMANTLRGEIAKKERAKAEEEATLRENSEEK